MSDVTPNGAADGRPAVVSAPATAAEPPAPATRPPPEPPVGSTLSPSASEGSGEATPGAVDGTGEPPSERAAPARLRCVCGHDRAHYLVSPVPTYSGWAKFWVIFMGVSTKPSRVDFQCRQCRRVFDFTEDSTELGQFL